MAQIHSGTGIGQWFFGSSNSTNNDNNFLRVSNAFPNRRLSDNTLMTPKIRIAPSCASSPGGTPGGNSGLPTRRHSSIGPQERRGSAVNLSPPTVSYISPLIHACRLIVWNNLHTYLLKGLIKHFFELNRLMKVDCESSVYVDNGVQRHKV